jgi:hypothetical protein
MRMDAKTTMMQARHREGQRLDPTAVPDFSGTGYDAYCTSLRAILDRERISPHLADLVLANAARQEGDEDADAKSGNNDGGFSEAGFQLLADLASTPNVRKEWFYELARRQIWEDHVKQPLTEMVRRLGKDLLVPLVNQREAIAPDRLVVEPRRPIARPNSKSARPNGSFNYPYLLGGLLPRVA